VQPQSQSQPKNERQQLKFQGHVTLQNSNRSNRNETLDKIEIPAALKTKAKTNQLPLMASHKYCQSLCPFTPQSNGKIYICKMLAKDKNKKQKTKERTKNKNKTICRKGFTMLLLSSYALLWHFSYFLFRGFASCFCFVNKSILL